MGRVWSVGKICALSFKMICFIIDTTCTDGPMDVKAEILQLNFCKVKKEEEILLQIVTHMFDKERSEFIRVLKALLQLTKKEANDKYIIKNKSREQECFLSYAMDMDWNNTSLMCCSFTGTLYNELSLF